MSRSDEYNDVLLPDGAPVAKKGNKTCLILGIIGGIFVALALCCGIGGYYLMGSFASEFGKLIVEDLSGLPAIEDNLGELTETKVEWFKTGEVTNEKQQQNPKDKASYMVFAVKGTKGSGLLVLCITDKPGQNGPIDLENSELRMNNGDVFPLGEPLNAEEGP